MIIKIPVQYHVRQYLINNPEISKPFQIKEGDNIFGILIPLLEPKRKSELPLRYAESRYIECKLSSNHRYGHKIWLPKWKAKHFDDHIDQMIRTEFKSFIEFVKTNDETKKVDEMIRYFEGKYQLQDTILNFSTLKRMYYRSREKKLKTMQSS